MRTFKTKAFARFATREANRRFGLCEAVRRAERGLVDADPGSGVIKQRIAREGSGRVGGFRTIVLFRRGERAFLVYGFAKSRRENLRQDELTAFRRWPTSIWRWILPIWLPLWCSEPLSRRHVMSRRYKSEAFAAAHEAALGFAEAGVMSKRTMRVFDKMFLTPVAEMEPDDIRALRLRENASQAVFARYLKVTTSLVSQWQRGERRPRGASLQLLTPVEKHGLSAVA